MTYSIVPRFSCVRLYILRGRPFPSLYAHYSFKSGRTDEFLIPLCSLPPLFLLPLTRPSSSIPCLLSFSPISLSPALLPLRPVSNDENVPHSFSTSFRLQVQCIYTKKYQEYFKKIVYIHIDVYIARAYIYLNVDGDRGREDVLHLCIRGRLIRRSLSVWRRFNLVRKRKS